MGGLGLLIEASAGLTRSLGLNDVLAAILEHVARTTDMRLIAITDHDNITGALLARQIGHEFGVEVITRCNPKGVLLGYFFRPKRPVPAGLEDVLQLRASDAAMTRKFSHLGLKGGIWPVIGLRFLKTGPSGSPRKV